MLDDTHNTPYINVMSNAATNETTVTLVTKETRTSEELTREVPYAFAVRMQDGGFYSIKIVGSFGEIIR